MILSQSYLLLEEKFNKEKNFQEYIKTLENFINYE